MSRQRVVLVFPSATYRAPDFVDAAGRLGAEVVVASEVEQALAEQMGERALHIDLCDPDAAAVAIASREPDAVVAVDDQGVEVAALAAAKLGLPHNPPEAVRITRDKAAMRRLFTHAGLEQPPFASVGADDLFPDVGFPCVVKATSLSASRGVIRADTPDEAKAAVDRVRTIVDDPDVSVLVEGYVPGAEVAVEGLLRDGALDVLAIFDKPDPLEGPYFEETIYVTPSRLSEATETRIAGVVAAGVAAIGLREGPVHAEARIDGDRVVLLEAAARSIGGLCSRTLRFGLGMSLEEVILRHALGRPLGRFSREAAAAGVMMVPIPHAGVLHAVGGREAAVEVDGIVGLEITATIGKPIRPLPEGDRYLGFLFARGDSPEGVEAALRAAHRELRIDIR